MTPEPTTRRSYKVTSLERGLTVLKTLASAGKPMRNQDLVARTGLPKATVSRLMHTLTSLGYLRRTDLGNYVPADLGSRSGRVMLAGLDLGRHAALFEGFLGPVAGHAVLATRAGDTLVPVFQWSPGADTCAWPPPPRAYACRRPRLRPVSTIPMARAARPTRRLRSN